MNTVRVYTKTGFFAHKAKEGAVGITLCYRPAVELDDRREKDRHHLAQASVCSRCDRMESRQ